MSSQDCAFGVLRSRQKKLHCYRLIFVILVAPITNQLYDPETKRFECKECKATFRMFSNLKNHLDRNRCLKYAYQCPQCSIVFSNPASFTKHLKQHMGKTFECDMCGDKFINDKGLQRHTKIYHTELNQQFQCQYCTKLFSRKNLLENHIRRHFNYRPFKCNYCDKSFKTRQYLTGHINGVHKNDKQFVCNECDARFSWRSTWKRHMNMHALKQDYKTKNRLRLKKPSNSNILATTALFTASNTVLSVHASSTLLGPNSLQPDTLGQNVVQLTQTLPGQVKDNSFLTIHNPHLAAITQLTQQGTNMQQNINIGQEQATPQLAHLSRNFSQIQQTNPEQQINNMQQTQQSLPQAINHLAANISQIPTQLEQQICQLPVSQLQRTLAQLPRTVITQFSQPLNPLAQPITKQSPVVQSSQQGASHPNADN